jgi:hypothetical protein
MLMRRSVRRVVVTKDFDTLIEDGGTTTPTPTA